MFKCLVGVVREVEYLNAMSILASIETAVSFLNFNMNDPKLISRLQTSIILSYLSP